LYCFQSRIRVRESRRMAENVACRA
jgi:hypothetical protein